MSTAKRAIEDELNDQGALEEGAEQVERFWEKFDRTFSPKRASLKAYKEALENLVADAEMRLEGVRDDLKGQDE